VDIFPESLSFFKRLIQFNTTNPPGHEREAIAYIAHILQNEGFQPLVLESTDRRANLVVRLKGNGTLKPLHISSHVDVVSAEAEHWKYPPFSAEEAEGCIWGRGAIDMKNMTAYCLGALLTLKREGRKLKRDLIMSVVADEENGGRFGMGWLAEYHPDLIRSEYYLGEVGGYSIHLQGKRVYPIQVGEKGSFWIKVKFRGTPGHGSIPNPSNVHFKLSKFLNLLNAKTLPRHFTKTSKAFIESLADISSPVGALQFKVMQTGLGPLLLRKMAMKSPMPEKYLALGAMLSNTATPTGVESGFQHNVVPSEVILKLDCRILPGFTGEDVIRELENLWDEKLEYEIISQSSPHECDFDTPLFKEISRQVKIGDPEGIPVPSLTVGSTDAQHIRKLGTICYGFTPIKLTEDINFAKLFHGHNERIPVEGFKWGLQVFINTVRDFCS